jgi:CheY-like chemotaxis protein
MKTRILVVEDNENNRYLTGYILRKHGHKVIEAVSGEEGLELALKEQPDLILMDIHLPGMDGLEAMKRIRASEAVGGIPIIALTSYAMTGDKERALKVGCTGYIEKPIDPETIMANIESYL